MEENYQDEGERKAWKDSYAAGQRQVDGGFWKDVSRKKDEAIRLPDVLTILRRVLESFQ